MSGVHSGSVVAALAAISFASSSILGQFEEIEPNQTCAQIEGPVAVFEDIPLEITGELSPGPVGEGLGDVDFFYFEAPGGVRLTALLSMEAEPSGDFFQLHLGLFDTECNTIRIAPFAYASYPDGIYNRIDITPQGTDIVPFFLAVSAYADEYNFPGNHTQSGPYTLRLVEPAAPVQIAGRAIDELTRQPVHDGLGVTLYRCIADDCRNDIARDTDDNRPHGQFGFSRDSWGDFPLDPGTYLIQIQAWDYEIAEIGPFEVGPGEFLDLGDIPLQPVPFVFENVVHCSNLSSEGGICSFTVDLRNNSENSMDGFYWFIVEAGVWNPARYPTRYQPKRAQRVLVEPLSSITLQSRFRVPPGVADGTHITVYGYFSDRTVGHFDVLRMQALFSVIKLGERLATIDR